MTFFDRLRDRIRATDGLLAVELTPDPARLPDDCREYDYPRRAFNRRIVDATHDRAAAYLVNPAGYADAEGWTALAETVAYARGRSVPVVLDGKYAAFADGQRADLLDRVDAVTVSPFLGRDAFAAALDRDLGVFVTCRTPNAGGANVQDRELASGESLAERVAALAGEWAVDATADVGLLVGGSNEELERLRERAPDRPFLVVGGAKNDPEVAEHAAPETGDNEGTGLVAASRAVVYAGETAGRERGADAYASAARQSARRLAGQLNRHR